VGFCLILSTPTHNLYIYIFIIITSHIWYFLLSFTIKLTTFFLYNLIVLLFFCYFILCYTDLLKCVTMDSDNCCLNYDLIIFYNNKQYKLPSYCNKVKKHKYKTFKVKRCTYMTSSFVLWE
jgi:hypothetical protein